MREWDIRSFDPSKLSQTEKDLENYQSGIVDLDGHVDQKTGIKYLGSARRQHDGTWHCLADVGGALCLVEVKISV